MARADCSSRNAVPSRHTSITDGADHRGRRLARAINPNQFLCDFRCRIEIEGVVITPGDLVFGDVDGVIVVPRELEVEVVMRALEKTRAEKTVRKAIEDGMSTTTAFEQFGIL